MRWIAPPSPSRVPPSGFKHLNPTAEAAGCLYADSVPPTFLVGHLRYCQERMKNITVALQLPAASRLLGCFEASTHRVLQVRKAVTQGKNHMSGSPPSTGARSAGTQPCTLQLHWRWIPASTFKLINSLFIAPSSMRSYQVD